MMSRKENEVEMIRFTGRDKLVAGRIFK